MNLDSLGVTMPAGIWKKQNAVSKPRVEDVVEIDAEWL
jgi:hypothetical protein